MNRPRQGQFTQQSGADIFNYSTGPVQLSLAVRDAMAGTYSSSHMPQAHQLVAETLDLVHRSLSLPKEYMVFLLPGSIRQALERVIRSVAAPRTRVLALTSGYWGRFLAGCAERAGATVVLSGYPLEGSPEDADVLLSVHVETEHGEILPTEAIGRGARGKGTLVIADVACSVPVDVLDPESFDIAVLGSHKCLGGPPGLGVIVVRLEATKRLCSSNAHWDIPAYLGDAQHKYAYNRGESASPFGSSPAVTYPIQVVAGLHAALQERKTLPGYSRSSHAAAAAAIRHAAAIAGLQPYVGSWPQSNAVVRLEVPAPLREDELRGELLEAGMFVIGNIGDSAGRSIRIGTMSAPQVDPANVDRLVAELTRAVNKSFAAVGKGD